MGRGGGEERRALVCSGRAWAGAPSSRPLHRSSTLALCVLLLQAVAALAVAPAYLALDLSHVQGLDATGARTMGVVHRWAAAGRRAFGRSHELCK